ncbi:hypothetical protein FRC02_008239 [Tulasnella sp. 418]|nr:hypothetical protein FRC02_008239 [Tulasnella sp. 418]
MAQPSREPSSSSIPVKTVSIAVPKPDHSPRLAPSAVLFPSSQEPQTPNLRTAPRPLPPFRRISLPSAPSSAHRASVASVQSFDSLTEEPASGDRTSAFSPSRSPQTNAHRRPRPSSLIGASPSRARQRPSSRRRRAELLASGASEDDDAKEEHRRHVIREFVDTERTYFQGLELIYEHFLMPLVKSLETSQPLLTAPELNSVFANFVDIWNFHRIFLSELSDLQETSPGEPLSPLLSQHFPYLSLYTPFITAFSDAVVAMVSLCDSSPAFGSFLKTREADPKCQKLSLQSWFLTIVQRCPRYLLLLKDLIGCTDPESEEYQELLKVHALASKITSGLNTSLQVHSQTVTLVALQRSTPNLPFLLISPGRTLIKRGTLLHVDREQYLRDFLLFSDCLIWLSKGSERERGWPEDSSYLSSPILGNLRSQSSITGSRQGNQSNLERTRPSMMPRQRSKSAIDLPTWRGSTEFSSPSSSSEERWWFRGRADLMDIEVVVSTIPTPGEDRRFDVLGLEGSFILYATSKEDRDEWIVAIREAKSSLLSNFSITHPNSTLTSSSSTAHVRRVLQALPYPPTSVDETKSPKENSKGLEKRRKVDHFVPAVWVPDKKASACMRCGEAFGLLRRRHHCRLCGSVVCANCSERSFYVAESSNSQPSKPMRACNNCYDTVFPVLPPSPTKSIFSRTKRATFMLDSNEEPSVSVSSGRPSTMHVPTLPDIPSSHSFLKADGEFNEETEAPEGAHVQHRKSMPSSSSPLVHPLPIPVTPPRNHSNPRISIARPPSLPHPTSSYTAETGGNAPTPPLDSQYSIPEGVAVNLALPASFVSSNSVLTTSSVPEPPLTSPLSLLGGKRSRASLPVLAKSRLINDGDDDVPPELVEALTSSSVTSLGNSRATMTGPGVHRPKPPKTRRRSFTPSSSSSSALHMAPVMIYPVKKTEADENRRFSLVLDGKGTIGRGSHVVVDDIEDEDEETAENGGDPVGEGTSHDVQHERGRRLRAKLFEGLEKGVAAGKLSQLLGRSKRTDAGKA